MTQRMSPPIFEVQTSVLKVPRETPVVPSFRYGPNSPPKRCADGSFPFFDIVITSHRSIILMASVGQASTQSLHPVQASRMIFAF